MLNGVFKTPKSTLYLKSQAFLQGNQILEVSQIHLREVLEFSLNFRFQLEKIMDCVIKSQKSPQICKSKVRKSNFRALSDFPQSSLGILSHIPILARKLLQKSRITQNTQRSEEEIKIQGFSLISLRVLLEFSLNLKFCSKICCMVS